MKGMVIFFVGLLLSGRSSGQNVLVWDSATKLTRADFQGKADSHSPYSASTASGIFYKFSLSGDGYRDSIMAVFYKSDSWVKVEQEREDTENRYDIETKHSADAERQVYWNAKIRNELKELDQYGN